jgi:hypothetical protein
VKQVLEIYFKLTFPLPPSAPTPTPSQNFDKDLHDCRVFGAVLASHVPSLSSTMATLKKTDVLSGDEYADEFLKHNKMT